MSYKLPRPMYDFHITYIVDGKIYRGMGQDVATSAVEGIDWISNHHADASDDARAMLAAWLLRGPKAQRLEAGFGWTKFDEETRRE